jgi:hypothetical protein
LGFGQEGGKDLFLNKIEDTINIFKNKLSVIEVLHDHLSCSSNFLKISNNIRYKLNPPKSSLQNPTRKQTLIFITE